MSVGVVAACYQGIMGHKAAEERLREAEVGSYLTRESDIKKGKFVLSFVSKSNAVKHSILRNPAFRKEFNTIEEGSEVMERMIVSSDDCVQPVPPLVPDHNNNSLDDCPASELACYACEFVAGHRRELNSHLRVHYVKECSSCSKFIPENAATSHRVKCQEAPPVAHSCGQCDYKSVYIHAVRDHEKRIHGKEHKCNVCMKAFDDEETLSRHQESAHGGGGFKCQDCDKTFKTLYNRDRHRNHHHRMIQSQAGFMMLDVEHFANTSPPPDKGQRHKCPEPDCPHVAQSKVRLNRHILARHQANQSPRKVYKCDGCNYTTSKTSNFRVHLLTCLKHKELHPRVVRILTKKQLVKIKKMSSISDRKFIKLLQEIEKEAGQTLFEGNLERELRESIDSWGKFYEVKEVEILDKNGNPMKSSLAWVNDLNGLISAIIKETGIKRPRVVVGGDSGQGKFIFTLTILDMDDLGKDSEGYSRAGKRRTLVIAACDDCNESHENINQILDHLKLEELEIVDWILAGDLKFANVCFGLQAHGCTHNCVYCEGSRWLDGKETTKGDGDWRPGETMRTPERNMGNRARWIKRWPAHRTTRRAHLGEYKNCEHPHIPLPPDKVKIEIIFLLPPDPPHVILLGPVQDIFTYLRKNFPGVMTEFFRRCGIGRKRSMVAGNFTGVELKMLIKETSLADLSQLIPNGVEITRYLRSMRELHKMVVKKEFSPDHQTYIDNFEECFKVVRDLGLVNFTTKVHIILHHFSYYMSTTQESLYSSDTSATESTHSGIKNLQRVHNLLSTHNLGSVRQQYRLRRTLMRYNWGNLPFDMREGETSSEATDQAPVATQEVEDLSMYLQDQVVEEEQVAVCDKQECEALRARVAELEEQIRILSLGQASSS